MVDLDGTVEEVKENIRNASDPDYDKLLKKEKEGKNRKTIIEFLEKKADEGENKSLEEDEQEELVEEIEEETEGGILGGYTKPQVMTGGILLGILVSMIIITPAANYVGGQQAQGTVQGLLDSSQSSAEITNVKKTGFYNLTLQDEITRNNQTVTRTQNWYLSSDGKKLIPEVVQTPLGGYPVVRDVEDLKQGSTSSEEEKNDSTEETPTNSTNTTSNTSN